jgi:predicted small secreted protein
MIMKYVHTVLLVLIASSCLITGCNTAKGFGQDMQEGGQAIQKAAHDATNDGNKSGKSN